MQGEGPQEDLISKIGAKLDDLTRIPLKPGVIIAISLASFFVYYDVSNYAYISPILRKIWHVSDSEIAFGAFLTIVGYLVGAILITLLSDSKGRKVAFMISVLLLGVGSIASALSQNMAQLLAFRFITGAAIGSELAIASVYIGEISPKAKRGKYTSLLVVLGWLGLTSSGPISLALLQGQPTVIEGWRAVLGIAGVVALISLPFRLAMPESPRWLATKGRVQKANEILVAMGVTPLEPSSTISSSPSHQKVKISRFGFLKEKVVLSRIIFLVAIWSLLYIPVYSALLLTVEYINQGYILSESLSINLLGGVGFVAGGVLAIFVGDKMERKYQVALAGALLSLGFVLRGLLIHDFSGSVIAGFIAFFANAWVITALLTYTAENFATRIRSSAVGIVEGISRGVASISPLIFVLLEPNGFLSLMVGISVFSSVAAGIICSFGVRTSRKSLEKISIDST